MFAIDLLSNQKFLFAGNFGSGTGSTNTFDVLVEIPYTTTIPLNKALTVISGKTLTTNDVFTIGTLVNGGCTVLRLIGDGTHSPNISAFDYYNGSYDMTNNTINFITMYYLYGNTTIEITQQYPI